jgi:hypothetical protein
MKYNAVRPISAALFLIIVIFSSCDKQDNGTGIGLFARNNELGISFIDSFTVNSRPRFENTIRTNGFSDVLLGSYFDPFFGNTKISFYTQFLINGSGIQFRDGSICDSIVFYAKLGVSTGDQFYGSENEEMTFNVHQISSDADFSIDSNYFTYSSLEIINESLLDPTFNNTFTPNFVDTVQVGADTTDKFLGVLKLNLDPLFGQEIIDLSGTEVLLSNDEFQKVYKGLYITTDGVQDGSILNIDYSSNATTMVMFMHKDTVTADSAYTIIDDYEFNLTSDITAHFSEYIHDYEGSGSSEFLAIYNDTSLGNIQYYMQAGGGFAADIKFPTLHSIRDSDALFPISKAELILPVDSSTTDEYAPGNQLFISRIDENGQKVIIADQGNPILGGFYDDFRSEYRFVITGHIQSFINGEISSPDVRVEINKPGTSPNRIILNGHDIDTTNGVKNLLLRIYFSTLNE